MNKFEQANKVAFEAAQAAGLDRKILGLISEYGRVLQVNADRDEYLMRFRSSLMVEETVGAKAALATASAAELNELIVGKVHNARDRMVAALRAEADRLEALK